MSTTKVFHRHEYEKEYQQEAYEQIDRVTNTVLDDQERELLGIKLSSIDSPFNNDEV